MPRDDDTRLTPEEEAQTDGGVLGTRRDLAEQRALAAARRTHRRETRQARVEHWIGMADLRGRLSDRWRERREAGRDRRESSQLTRLFRRASLAGERARVAAAIKQSAEVRALRVQRVRSVALLVLVPVLLLFAAWSTAGVHHGFVTLLGVVPGSPMWWTGWGVEPALITIVAGIIIVRAVLRSSGGDLDWRAGVLEWVALSTSIALNMAGHWPETGSFAAVAAVVAHSIGPIGAAATAFLIGLVDDAVHRADPHKGAPPLNRIDLGGRRIGMLPDRAGESDPVGVEEVARSDADRVDSSPGPRAGSGPVPGSDTAPVPVERGEPRTGPVEDAAAIRAVDGKSGPHRSMDDLKADMAEAVRSGELDRNTVDAIVTAVRTGKSRARRLRGWADETGLFERVPDRSADRFG